MIRGSFVFVSNLPTGATEEEVRDLFGTVGEVVNVRLEYDVKTNRPTGSGFVQLSDDQGAKSAVDRLNGTDFQTHAIRVNHSKKLSRPLDVGSPTARSETLIKVAGFVKRSNGNQDSMVSEQGQSSIGDSDPDHRFLTSTVDPPEVAVPEEPTPPFQRNTTSRRSFTFNNILTHHASGVQVPHVFPHKDNHASRAAYYSTWANDETVYHVGRLETSFTSDDVPPLLERYDSLRPSTKYIDAVENAVTDPLSELGERNSSDHFFTRTESPIQSTQIAHGTPPAMFEDSRNEQRFTVNQKGSPENVVSTAVQSKYDPESLSRITECSEDTAMYQNVSTPGRTSNVTDATKGKPSIHEASGEQRLIIYATGRPQQTTTGANPSAFGVGNDTANWIADLVKQASAPPSSQPVEPFANSVELPAKLSTARVKPMDQHGIIQASAKPTTTAVPIASPPGSPKKERRSHGLMKLLNRNKHKIAEPYSGPTRYWYRTPVMREEPIELYVNVYHSGRSDEPTTVANSTKVHADELTRSQITRYFKNATTLQDYPVSEPYVGQLSVKRMGPEIKEEPLVHHVTVYHSGRSDEPPSLPDEVPLADYPEASHKNSGRPLKKHADNKKYPPSHAYQGPVYTYRNTDFHCVPLEHYVTVYHHGRSDEPNLPI